MQSAQHMGNSQLIKLRSEFFGQVTDGVVKPNEWKSIEVSAGDSFVIPEGCAHQLRKTGSEALTILFGCPDSHLDDDKDRYLLPDAPLAI